MTSPDKSNKAPPLKSNLNNSKPGGPPPGNPFSSQKTKPSGVSSHNQTNKNSDKPA